MEGVTQMLTILCYAQSGLELLTAFPFIPFGLWTLAATFPSAFFTSLKIHGIRTRNPKYIKAFIIFQYTLYILGLLGMFVGSIYLSAFYSQFWIFLLGVMVMMYYTFIWIFDIGFIITLKTLLEEKDRFRNVYSMEEVMDA